jgi:hypothetical protein
MGALAPRGDQGHLQLRSPGCRLDDRGGRAQLAIIDSSTVFLAFSGVSEQDIRGLSFKAELALTYFEVYFNQLWNAAMPLERGRCGSPMPASSDWRRCGWSRPGRSRPSPSRGSCDSGRSTTTRCGATGRTATSGATSTGRESVARRSRARTVMPASAGAGGVALVHGARLGRLPEGGALRQVSRSRPSRDHPRDGDL